MKKINLVGVAAIVVIFFASCSKDYTCTCAKKDASGASLPSVSFTIKDTNKGAKQQCPNIGDIPAGETWDCTLK